MSDAIGVKRIVGGGEADEDDRQYAQVSLQTTRYRAGNKHKCGGSVVAHDIVLTSAHCQGEFERIEINRHDFSDRTERVASFGKTSQTCRDFRDFATN